MESSNATLEAKKKIRQQKKQEVKKNLSDALRKNLMRRKNLAKEGSLKSES